LTDTADGFSPYVGLGPYTEEYREYFFGRDREARLIIANLHAASFTVLYGGSGVGKSSVLLAHVVPTVHASGGAIVVFRDWHDRTFLDALKQACVAEVGRVRPAAAAPDPSLPLDALVEHASVVLEGPLFLVLDQFDEYFTNHPEPYDEFERELARLVNRDTGAAGVMIALRDDALSRLDRLRGRIANLMTNTLRLRPLTVAGAREALVRPLEVYGRAHLAGPKSVQIDGKLVDDVLRDVRASAAVAVVLDARPTPATPDEAPIEASVLQLVMERLWEEDRPWQSRVIRRETYRKLGGAAEIVRHHVTDVIDDLTPRERDLCAGFFDHLVTPSLGMKIPVSAADVAGWNRGLRATSEECERLLDRLANAKRRVLRAVQVTRNGGSAVVYEVFHDALGRPLLDWQSAFDTERAKRAAAWTWVTLTLSVTFGLGLIGAGVAVTKILSQKKDLADNRQTILRQKDRATSDSLTLRAGAVLNQDPEVSVILANAALSRAETQDAANALRDALTDYRLIRTLVGHDGAVRGARFVDANGTRVVTAGEDGTTRLWDVATGTEIRSFHEEGWATLDAAVVGDAVVAVHMLKHVDGRTVRLRSWDAGTGVVRVSQDVEDVRTLAIAAGGARVIFAVGDVVRVVDLARPAGATNVAAEVWQKTFSNPVIRVAIDESGTVAAVRSRGIAVCRLDAQDSCATVSAGSAQDALMELGAMAFSPDGKRLAAIFPLADLPLSVFDVATRSRATVPGVQVASDSVLAWSDDGRAVVTSTGTQGTVSLVEKPLVQAFTLSGHTAPITTGAFSSGRSPRLLATGSADGTARIWNVDIGSDAPNIVLRGHQGTVRSIRFSSDADRLLTTGEDGTARVWTVRQDGESFLGQLAHTVLFGGNGAFAHVRGVDDTASVVRVSDGKLLRAATLVGVHTNGPFAVEYGGHGTVSTVDLRDPTHVVHDVRVPDQGIEVLAIDAAGERVAVAYRQDVVRVFDAPSGRALPTLSAPPGTRVLQLSASGKFVAAGSPGLSQIVVHQVGDDASNGHPVGDDASGGPGGGLALADLPSDARRFAFGGTSHFAVAGTKSLALYDLPNPQATTIELDAQPQDLTFSPDASRVLVKSEGAIAIWKVSGVLLTQIGTDASTVGFRGDGNALVAAEGWRLFRPPPWRFDELKVFACGRVRRVLTDTEWRHYAPDGFDPQPVCPPPSTVPATSWRE
jgi:WD40 repeat protein